MPRHLCASVPCSRRSVSWLLLRGSSPDPASCVSCGELCSLPQLTQETLPSSLHHLNLLPRQPIQAVHHFINQPIRLSELLLNRQYPPQTLLVPAPDLIH